MNNNMISKENDREHENMLDKYPDIMSVCDLQSALGIGRSKAYQRVRSGEIKSIKIGDTIRIPKYVLLEYIDNKLYNKENMDKCLQ